MNSQSPFDRTDRIAARAIRAVGEVIDIVTYHASKAFWWYAGLLVVLLAGAVCLKAII